MGSVLLEENDFFHFCFFAIKFCKKTKRGEGRGWGMALYFFADLTGRQFPERLEETVFIH